MPPAPKRSEERRRRNRRDTDRAAGVTPSAAEWKADGSWHPVAARWFRSLGRSGQAAYYQPSDLAVARYLAEMMSRSLYAEKPSAGMVQALLSGTSALLSTEADRRRLRLELERREDSDSDEDAAAASMQEYRRMVA